MSRFADFWIEYRNHAVLNLGQALQGIRYWHSHPDMDARVPRGSLRHFLLSIGLRTCRIGNDLFFAGFPPHWHHGPAEVRALHRATPGRWFQYGYRAWRFGEDGGTKVLTGREDRRWDPRCKGAPPAG